MSVLIVVLILALNFASRVLNLLDVASSRYPLSSTSSLRKASCRLKISPCWNWGYFLWVSSGQSTVECRGDAWKHVGFYVLLNLDDVHGGREVNGREFGVRRRKERNTRDR